MAEEYIVIVNGQAESDMLCKEDAEDHAAQCIEDGDEGVEVYALTKVRMKVTRENVTVKLEV